MAKNRKQLIHLHTPDVKAPSQGVLNLGEIAVQHNDTEAALYIEKNNGTIAKFIDESAVKAKIEVEKLRAEGVEGALDDRINTLEGSNHTHANKEVLDGITSDKVAAWDAAEANASAYTDSAIAALKLDETYAKKSVVSTLVGEDTGKSVRSVSAEEVAKIVNGADTRYDTLKEIADWIISDTTGSAQMANDISALKAISADTRLVKLENVSHSHSNKDLLDSYTQTNDNLADAVAKKHEHTNKEVLDGITAIKVAAWDAAEANASAYTDSAITALDLANKYEAKGAAADAFASAKTYTDGLDVAMGSRVDALTSAVTDNEKVVATALNQIVKSVGLDENGNSPLPQNISLTDAIKDVTNKVGTLESSNHTHANKTVLDGITTEKVNAWDSAKADAISSAKTYVDSLNIAMDGRVDALETSSHSHDNKTVLDGITDVKVAAWDAAKADAISSAKTYTDATIEALNLASTYEAKGTAQSLINGLKLPETYAKKEVESTISTLVGKDTGKSVRSVSAEEVAKIVNSADTRYDTLKEIADWIISDTTGSAQMANDISALKAISAGTRLDTLESKSHSHSNIDLLETYTQTESNLADAVAKKHEHTNKAVLDGITDVKVAAWDAAEGKAKAYVDGKVDGKFDDKGAAAQALKDAKTYADGKADKVHTHAIADVTDLQDALDGKAASTHAHAIADVTGLQGALNGKAASAHTHAIADVTGLQGALDGKAASAHTHAIADVTGLQDALDGKDSQGAAAQALVNAKAYTDEKLAAIIIDCGTY